MIRVNLDNGTELSDPRLNIGATLTNQIYKPW
jgi:hypothetical protein